MQVTDFRYIYIRYADEFKHNQFIIKLLFIKLTFRDRELQIFQFIRTDEPFFRGGENESHILLI